MRVLAVCAALAVMTAVTFGRAVTFGFVTYDDDAYVYENPHIRHGLTAKAVSAAFTHSHVSSWFPLAILSHAVDVEVFGIDKPNGHHFTSILIHGLNVILLFLVMKRMTSEFWLSAITAALFAVHPLHVEPVVWISSRKDVLSAFFWMLMLWAYADYTQRPTPGRYMVVMSWFTLGMLAKPVLVTAPLVLIFLDFWPLGRLNRNTGRRRLVRLCAEKVPLLAIGSLLAVVQVLVQRSGGATPGLTDYPLLTRLSNALVSYLAYAAKTIVPCGLAPYYPHLGKAIPAWQIAIALVVILSVSAGVFAMRRYRFLVVGWLWYLGTLVPTIGIVQVGSHAMADRYTYVPLIGLFIMVVWAGAEAVRTRPHAARRLASAVAVVWLVALTVMAWRQVGVWRNNETLYRHALHVEPNAGIMHNNLGAWLRQQGRLDEAYTHCVAATQFSPTYAAAFNNLGNVLFSMKRYDEATEAYNRAIELDSQYPEAYGNKGNALLSQGRYEAAIDAYRTSLRLNPDYADAHSNLGSALYSTGDVDLARQQYLETIRLRPNHADAHFNLGVVHLQQGHVEDAKAEWRTVLEIQPQHPRAREALVQVTP